MLAPTAGPRSLAIGLTCITLFSFWSATHYWLAGRAMQELQANTKG
jgi:hypothetical protein